MSSLKGKIALVTGATSGIGEATANAFADAGATVVVSGRNDDRGLRIVAEIEGRGGRALFVNADVAVAKDVEKLIAATVAKFGRIDIAFNNAGIDSAPTPLVELDEDLFDKVMAINVKGVWLSMKYQIQQMLKQGGGAIVNNASVLGLVSAPTMSPYVASKHAVIGLTKSAALEYATQGIRVNAVCPGVIETPMVARFTGGNADAKAQMALFHPMERLGTPTEVAAAVLWLGSDAASFVTGHALAVDGGYLAR